MSVPNEPQRFSLGQNVIVQDRDGTELLDPRCGVLSVFLGGDCEDEVWCRVRDIEGAEADLPQHRLSRDLDGEGR